MPASPRMKTQALGLLAVAALALSACAPAAPAPTAAPAKPAESKPAATVQPTTPPAAKPTEKPAAKAETKPAATAPAKTAQGKTEGAAAKPTEKPAAKAETKPAAKAETKPAAKADTQAVADFYRGKTVRIVTGASAGGGFDTFARLLARHMSSRIPGNPTVVVENQGQAGGLIAFNNVYNATEKDGTSIVFSPGSIMAQQLFDNPAAEFDATKFNWIGAQTTDTPACVATRQSGFTSIAQARDREMILAGTVKGSTTDDVPNVLKNVAGLNIRLVSGYAGASKMKLAIDSHETHGGCITWEGIRHTFAEGLQSGEINVIGQAGEQPHPELPNVPLFRSVARNDEERQLIDATMKLSEYTRVLALSPGVPMERVEAMREAFLATLNDAEFRAEAEKARIDIDPVPGAQVQEVYRDLMGMSPELVARLKAAIG